MQSFIFSYGRRYFFQYYWLNLGSQGCWAISPETSSPTLNFDLEGGGLSYTCWLQSHHPPALASSSPVCCHHVQTICSWANASYSNHPIFLFSIEPFLSTCKYILCDNCPIGTKTQTRNFLVFILNAITTAFPSFPKNLKSLKIISSSVMLGFNSGAHMC